MRSSTECKSIIKGVVHVNYKFFNVVIQFTAFIIPPDFLDCLALSSGIGAAIAGSIKIAVIPVLAKSTFISSFTCILEKLVFNFNYTERFTINFFIASVGVFSCKRHFDSTFHIKKFTTVMYFKAFTGPGITDFYWFFAKRRNALNSRQKLIIRIMKMTIFIAVNLYRIFFSPRKHSSC